MISLFTSLYLLAHERLSRVNGLSVSCFVHWFCMMASFRAVSQKRLVTWDYSLDRLYFACSVFSDCITPKINRYFAPFISLYLAGESDTQPSSLHKARQSARFCMVASLLAASLKCTVGYWNNSLIRLFCRYCAHGL